ncbi:MAG TPA: heme NO-binding protein [Oceanospirillales bacterium]|nr:heme NO-binding protein [Oceanospirillales bacterium]
MIGIIQRVLLDLLEETGGEPLKFAVMDRAGVPHDRDFRIDQNYPIDECLKLIQGAVDETGLSEDAINVLYAKAFLKEARNLFPQFFMMAKSSEQFLLRQATIHGVIASGLKKPEERQVVKDKFSARSIEPGFVEVTYRSPNKLCGLFRALAHEVAGIYGECLTVHCADCMKRGDDACRFELRWEKTAPDGILSSE